MTKIEGNAIVIHIRTFEANIQTHLQSPNLQILKKNWKIKLLIPASLHYASAAYDTKATKRKIIYLSNNKADSAQRNNSTDCISSPSFPKWQSN
jgi:lipopolysaccharide export system protein LptC